MVQYVYDAWGESLVLDGTGNVISSSSHIGQLNPFRYRGYFYDVETGLYYLKTRYYDPETGRFINMDSVVYAAPQNINGLNLYAYCGNNPVMNVDPNGTLLLGILFVGVGLLVTAVAIDHGVNGVMAYVADQNLQDSYTRDEAEVAIEECLGTDSVVRFTDDVIQIDESIANSSRYERIAVSMIITRTKNADDSMFTDRTFYDLAAEWEGHNIYNKFFAGNDLNMRERTKLVDLNADLYKNELLTIMGTIGLSALGWI